MSAGKVVGFIVGLILLTGGIIILVIGLTTSGDTFIYGRYFLWGLTYLGGFLIFFGILIIIGLVLHSAIKARREFKKSNQPV
ncbi:MAG: hypothetical protein ACXAC5_07670 [Promethearchaeota archaeon]|jgi:hypothetical protein